MIPALQANDILTIMPTFGDASLANALGMKLSNPSLDTDPVLTQVWAVPISLSVLVPKSPNPILFDSITDFQTWLKEAGLYGNGFVFMGNMTIHPDAAVAAGVAGYVGTNYRNNNAVRQKTWTAGITRNNIFDPAVSPVVVATDLDVTSTSNLSVRVNLSGLMMGYS